MVRVVGERSQKSWMGDRKHRASILIMALTMGCAPRPAPRTFDAVTSAEWRQAQSDLTRVRAGSRQHVEEVQAEFARGGFTMTARGMLAVEPGRALRMVLLGPTGSTAVDLWITPTAWRVSVPAANIEHRGTSDEGARWPVGFFRSWLLSPLSGRLVAGAATPTTRTWVLRSPGAGEVLDCAWQDGCASIRSVRYTSMRAATRVERVSFRGLEVTKPSPGDEMIYEDTSEAIRVHVRVLAVSSEPPEREVFEEPRGDR